MLQGIIYAQCLEPINLELLCYREDKGPDGPHDVNDLAVAGAHSGALPPPVPEEPSCEVGLASEGASVGELGPDTVLATAFTQCVCSQRSVSHRQCITLSRP